ncbi:MAG: hypothetical protein ABJC66_00995 [Gammaproteobacteria bacterium]
MKKVNVRRCAGVATLHACAVVVALSAASVIALPASAESTTPQAARATKPATAPVRATKPYVSPYTRAAMAQHTGAAHVMTGSAPTAMQAAGKHSRAHAPAKR